MLEIVGRHDLHHISPLLASENVRPKNAMQPLAARNIFQGLGLPTRKLLGRHVSHLIRTQVKPPPGEHDTFRFPGKIRNLLGTRQQLKVDTQPPQAMFYEVDLEPIPQSIL
jgi:hypothetical protein